MGPQNIRYPQIHVLKIVYFGYYGFFAHKIPTTESGPQISCYPKGLRIMSAKMYSKSAAESDPQKSGRRRFRFTKNQFLKKDPQNAA